MWVPVARADGWPETVHVEDAFGREHHCAAGGPYCFFEDERARCRMGILGVVVRSVGGGLYRVQLGDGLVVVARLGSDHQWERAA